MFCRLLFKVRDVHRNKSTRLDLPGSFSAPLKIYMMSPAPNGKQLKKPHRDSVRQIWGEQEACSLHNFPTSHVLRIQPSMKHRKPKKPFPMELHSRQIRRVRGIHRAQRGTNGWVANGNSTLILQLGAQRNQRANSAKKVKKIRLQPSPPAINVVWVLGEARTEH